MEATEPGQQLIDAYIGVEFSVVYEVSIIVNKAGKPLKGTEKFYCYVSGSGIDPKIGRSDISKEFSITPDNLEATTTKTIPKFRFDGLIYTTNCSFNEAFDGYVIIRDSEY